MLIWLIHLTRLLNHLFAGPLTAVMEAMGIHPRHPGTPINNAFSLELVVVTLLIVFFLVVRASLSIERPGRAQHLAEMVHEFVESQAQAVIGHGHETYLSYLTVILLFILFCNCMGLLPGILTPTASPVVPLGLALLTFAYYNFHGLRIQGPVGYFKHFLGPVWWIAPLMFPMEIVSHLARVMSLTVRLYANMFASDLLTLVFFSLIPVGVPIIFLGLHFGVALVQSYVFMLLTMIYLSQAVSHEEAH
jgi:F-type H+-transporting ATPase subunit a